MRACAFITFSHDKDACLAMSMGKTGINKKIIHCIFPVHKNEQPPSTIQQSVEDAPPNSDDTSLLMLNDYCLLKLFEYCDLRTLANVWKVCKRTQNLLESFVLPKKNEYVINFFTDKPEKTLKHVREELKCIGPHIKKLRFAEEEYSNYWTFGHNVQFYLKVCNEYVGRSLKELELDIMPWNIFSGGNLVLMRPLLLEIESLSIRVMDDRDFRKPIDIQVPKLKELKLATEYPGEQVNVSLLRKTFPNLERADIRLRFAAEEIEMFLKNHRKLQYLDTGPEWSDVDHLIETIAAESIDLKELVIRYPIFCDESNVALMQLQKNKALNKLLLYGCSYYADTSNETKVFEHLGSLQQLRLLMVTVQSDIHSNAFIHLGHEIPHLEHFCSNFVWNDSTIIEFIKRARHLKTFCVLSYEAGCPKVDFIQALVDVRKSMFPNGSHRIIVLELIIPLEKIPNVNTLLRLSIN